VLQGNAVASALVEMLRAFTEEAQQADANGGKRLRRIVSPMRLRDALSKASPSTFRIGAPPCLHQRRRLLSITHPRHCHTNVG